MNDLELIKMELAVQGIEPKGGDTFYILDDGKREQTNAQSILSKLTNSIKRYKKLFFEVWGGVVESMSNLSIGSGNETTQRMFANSLKILLLQTERFPVLTVYNNVVKKIMYQDVAKFNEKFMSDIIDAQVGLDWLNHLIRLDTFKIELLRSYLRKTMEKSVIAEADIAGIQGPWSNMDLPMKERVWSFAEDQDDFDAATRRKQQQGRYNLPETYNDPYHFEEGYFWRELRNDPYDPNDDEDNPYPHRDQLYRRP